MANIFSRLLAKATFWDQNDDRQIDKEDEEERKKKNRSDVSVSTSKQQPAFMQSNDQIDFTKPLKKDNSFTKENPTNLAVGSQSQFTLNKPKAPVIETPNYDNEVESLANRYKQDELTKLKKSKSWFGNTFDSGKDESIAETNARNRAISETRNKYTDSNNTTSQPVNTALKKAATTNMALSSNFVNDKGKADVEAYKKDKNTRDWLTENKDTKLGYLGGESIGEYTKRYNDANIDEQRRMAQSLKEDASKTLDYGDIVTAQKRDQAKILLTALDKQGKSKSDILHAIGDFGSGIVDNTVETLRNVGESGRVLATGKTVLDDLQADYDSGKISKDEFIKRTNEEYNRLGEFTGGKEDRGTLDRLLRAAGTGIDVASMVVPIGSAYRGTKLAAEGGKGLLKYVGKETALNAGLGAGGALRKGTDTTLGDIASEAAVSGVAGGLFAGGGALLSKARKGLSKVDKDGVDVETPQLLGSKKSDGEGVEIAPGLKSTNKPEVDVPIAQSRSTQTVEAPQVGKTAQQGTELFTNFNGEKGTVVGERDGYILVKPAFGTRTDLYTKEQFDRMISRQDDFKVDAQKTVERQATMAQAEKAQADATQAVKDRRESMLDYSGMTPMQKGTLDKMLNKKVNEWGKSGTLDEVIAAHNPTNKYKVGGQYVIDATDGVHSGVIVLPKIVWDRLKLPEMSRNAFGEKTLVQKAAANTQPVSPTNRENSIIPRVGDTPLPIKQDSLIGDNTPLKKGNSRPDVLTTVSGRKIQLDQYNPKGRDPSAKWNDTLIDAAIEEAKLRNDSMNLGIFEDMKGANYKNISQSDLSGIHQYLFGSPDSIKLTYNQSQPTPQPKPEVAQPKPSDPTAALKADTTPDSNTVAPTTQTQIPDVTNPIALAKAGNDLPPVTTTQGSEAPMADFSKAVQVPLQKAAPAQLDAVQAQPTTNDIAEAAATGDLRQSTRTDAEVDAQGNQTLRTDAAVVNDAIDSGIAPQRQGSPVATSEEAMQLAAENAAKQEVDMAAPRTRAEAVNLVESDAKRLEAAGTFKNKTPLNFGALQTDATAAIRDMPDDVIFAKYSTEPELKTPQDFFEAVAAVDRLGRSDVNNPVASRALTNALDSISTFSEKSGQNLGAVSQLFKNLPPAMRKKYLIDRVESKLGYELPDNIRAELLGKITVSDNTQIKIDDINARLQEAKRNIELGAPVDPAVVKADIDNLDKLTIVHEYQQGDAFQYSQDLLQSGTAGAKVAQATKTAMLSSPLRRSADVVTTGITSTSDTTSNAISGLIGRALNKLPGQAGKFRETRAGDYGVLAKGNIGGVKDSFTALRTDKRKVDDIMGELQKNTRSDANNAGRTRFGRFVGDMTESATNATQGQRDQRLRELARQEGQKIGLKGDDLDLYTQITEKIPNEVQKHEASQYHLRTNNLHDNKLNTAFRSVASLIEKQFPQGGPIITALTVPFKSYTAGNLNRLFTDKTVLGNAFTLMKSAGRGDTQGVVDALSKAAVNTGETLVLGSILTSAGLLKDTNDNGEDYAGPYLQTPFGDIPVGFFGPTGINMIVGHNLSKLADGVDIDQFINDFGKQAISFMDVAGTLGGDTPIQEVFSGQGDVTDRLIKAGGDTLRRPIPSVLGDLNAVGNTISGQDKPLTKATNEDGTTDYLKTEANRTIDKLGLGALLERDEGKSSQGILERITGGTRATDATNEAETERDVQKSIKDMEKDLKKAKVPLKDADIEDALDDGDYENAIKGLEFKVAKTEADPDATNSSLKNAKDQLLQAQLRQEGVPVTEDGIKARTEDGDFQSAILGYQYQLQKLGDSEDVPESKKQTMRDEITRLQVTEEGSYPKEIIQLYSDTSQPEWLAMGNTDSEDYDPDTYQLLYQYDQQLTENGVSKSSKGGDKAKFAVGKGGSGGGGGRGGGGGGSKKGFTTDIALQKFSGDGFSPQKYLSADSAESKSAIPEIAKVPNNDQSKKKKITISKGGRS